MDADNFFVFFSNENLESFVSISSSGKIKSYPEFESNDFSKKNNINDNHSIISHGGKYILSDSKSDIIAKFSKPVFKNDIFSNTNFPNHFDFNVCERENIYSESEFNFCEPLEIKGDDLISSKTINNKTSEKSEKNVKEEG